MRYLTGLRRNAFRHSFDLLDVSFSESTPALVEMTAEKAALVKKAIDGADGKCKGIRPAIVFVPESDLGGLSPADYLLSLTITKVKAQKAPEPKTEPAPKGKSKASKND